MDQGKLGRYLDLLVVKGLHVQKGQLVHLAGEACHRDLLHAISERCYDLGARYVHLELIEPRLLRTRVERSDSEHLDYVPSYVESWSREIVDGQGASLRLVGLEDPDLLEGLPARSMNTIRKAQYQARRYFYEKGIHASQVQWTVAAAATPGWAKRIFPDLPPERGVEQLWEHILRCSRCDSSDPIAVWDEHDRILKARAGALNRLRIAELHFVGPDTDLRVGLSEYAVFIAGSEQSSRAVSFHPNIPTEECFTTPDARKTNGTVKATRPFLVNGTLISGLKMRFLDGKVVEFSAESGEEVFAEYLASDQGANALGEVALVGIDSPIFESGVVFEEILFDENAACHIAVGSAYKFCLQDFKNRSPEFFQDVGCNESSVHTDIMISNENVSVRAQAFDGSTHQIIEGGRWKKDLL